MSKSKLKRYDYDGKPGTSYWVVTFVYSVERYGWGELDVKVEKLLGPCGGAGTGFGERDMDWAFADEKSAKRAAALLKPLCGDDAYCDIGEHVVDADD
jgi:hypothetical protein